MARDSQLAGDRVQTEYYLQFADHYFRVLSESRARFEEQNPRRQRDDEMDEDEGDEEMIGGRREAARSRRPPATPGAQRALQRRERRRAACSRDERAATRRWRVRRRAASNGGGETIPFDVLPPAIGRDESDTAEAADEETAPSAPPRTRTARPAEGDDEIAPAA